MDGTTSPASLSSTDHRRVTAVGLFRLAYEHGREQMLAHIHDAGHPGVTQAMISLFRFVSMDGRRPTDIAASAGLSKQATNNLLGELERLCYLERHRGGGDDGRGRIVRLTERGRALDAIVVDSGRRVEAAYRRRVGPRQWDVFKQTLKALIDAD